MNKATPPPLAFSTSPLYSGASLPSVQEVEERRSLSKDAVAGACAGVIAKTVVAPIERIKLLMQLRFSIDNQGELSDRKDSPSHHTTSSAGRSRSGAWEVTKRVYREQGILAFWRGNMPNVIRQGGTSAMNFLLMDWYKRTISPILVWSLQLPSSRDSKIRKKRRAFLSSFLSGGLAGGTVTTALYPVEFVRTRLAMDVGRGTVDAPRLYPGGMRDVCVKIWRADGWRGFYQGYVIALAGVVLYRALHLGGYDALKTEILHRRGHQVTLFEFDMENGKNSIEHSERKKIKSGGTCEGSRCSSPLGLAVCERFLAAQFVSIVAGTSCYPIDSIRRRLMMQAGLPTEQRLYRNWFDCFCRVLASEGVQGFYLGIGPNLVRSFGAALLLVAYDVFKVTI